MARSAWILDESKFLSTKEARRLLRSAKKQAEKQAYPGNPVLVRDYLIVNLTLTTGLRVSEVADLKCGDLLFENGKSSLVVRNGKGEKFRCVKFNGELRDHLVWFLQWKVSIGEPVGYDDPLLYSKRIGKALSIRAIQKAFKRCAARAGLSPHYSMHSLRHTYACHLYKASGWNLRIVQKQLGHSRIVTTQVYADVMEPDLQRALDRLYR